MERRCLKCARVNEQATGLPTEACPACGAIYAKVEATQATSTISSSLGVDLASIRGTLGKEGPGPDVVLSPEQLLLLFTPSPSVPRGRRMGSLGWGVFIGLMVGAIIISWSSLNRVGSIYLAANIPAPAPYKTAPIDIVPQDVIREIRANKKEALAYWKDKNVRLRELVVDVGENPYLHRPLLKLHSADIRTPVYAELLPGQDSVVKGLGIAEEVTVVCSTVQWGGDRLLLKGCRLSR